MIVTPARSTYKPVTAVKGENEDRPRSFADLIGAQVRGKANDNPAIAVTRNVPKDRAMNGQFFDELA
jgi:hypothetical protein